MRKDLFKKSVVIGMMLLFIGVATTPAIGLNLAKNNLIIDKSVDIVSVGTHDTHPEYYDITIWKLQPTDYEEETKRVSYDEAMEIKAAYEQIESSTDDFVEQTKQKNAVLRNYGVLSSDDTYENYEKEFSEWIKIQNKLKLLTIVNLFLQKFIDIERSTCISLMGLIVGYVHGPLVGLCFGTPVPGTMFLLQCFMGQGPAEVIATSWLVFPLPFYWYYSETDASTPVVAWMFIGIGYATYLPFILNMNKEGRFDFAMFNIMGMVTDEEFDGGK